MQTEEERLREIHREFEANYLKLFETASKALDRTQGVNVVLIARRSALRTMRREMATRSLMTNPWVTESEQVRYLVLFLAWERDMEP